MGRLDHIRFSAEEGKHDDLVMAVIQGVWFAEQWLRPQKQRIPREQRVEAFADYGGKVGDPQENLTSDEPWGIAWDPVEAARREGQARKEALEEEEKKLQAKQKETEEHSAAQRGKAAGGAG
jgi:hypothetical protein